MVIDENTYKLKEDNFYNKSFDKNQIVIGNSFSHSLNHFTGWLNRLDGEYKETAHYTITRKGEIYQHFDTNNYSNFVNEKRVDKKIISIVLENLGWLKKDLKADKYIDWVGNIYKRRVKVLEKRWRGQQYWDPYTPKQFNTTVKLVKFLCNKYDIDNKCVGHNTFIKDIEDFKGVVYRSNYYKDNTDVNPSWNFYKFKEKIEK